MTLAELTGELHALPRNDKLQVIQMLAADVAREEGVEPLDANRQYPVWSPFNAHDGAETLLRVLDQEAAQ